MVDRGLPAIPVAERTTVGASNISLTDLPALAGRTVYAAVLNLAPMTGSGSVNFAHITESAANQSGFLRRDPDASGGGIAFRPQFVGGGGAAGAYAIAVGGATAATAGRRFIVMVRLPDGLTASLLTVRGKAATRTGMDAGDGLTLPKSDIMSSAYDQCLQLLTFRGAHTWQQACQVHQWLAARWAADPTPPPIW